MIALIGCEESQVVTIELRKRGHEAYSCDYKQCSGGHPEWHLQMDVLEAIKMRAWDFIGLHPDCTKMTLSGNRHYAPGKPKHQERLDAVEWTIGLWYMAWDSADYVYMENPLGAMNGDTRLPKSQIIHPYYFGDEFQKTTCLWLKNLSPLYHNAESNLFDNKVTHVGKGNFITFPSGKKMSEWYAKYPFDKTGKRKIERSKTFPGIARAMAEQWG